MQNNFRIINQSHKKVPHDGAFLEFKKKILGSEYELELIFITPQESKRINKVYRFKNKPTNILSFSLNQKKGQIFIDLEQVKKEAKISKLNYKIFLNFLLIHGLLHLKGYEHGQLMEKMEQKYCQKFKINFI